LRRQVQGKIIDKKSNQRFSWIEINRKKENKNKTIATTPEKNYLEAENLKEPTSFSGSLLPSRSRGKPLGVRLEDGQQAQPLRLESNPGHIG